MNFQKIFYVVFCIFCFCIVSTGYSETISSEVSEKEISRFKQVFDQVKKSYVEDINDQTLMDYAIKGMISELDPHSAYLDQQDFADLQASITGEFAGVGLEIGLKSGFITVIAPIDDSPASKAGIEAGDRIVRVDDIPVKGLTITQVTRMLRGPKNTDVKITVFRNDLEDPFEFSLTRETIKIKSVRQRTLDNDFLYLRISSFQSNTGSDLQKLVDIYLDENPQTKGVILDLRNNPGGDLRAAITVTDVFLDGGLIVYTQGRLANSQIHYQAEVGDNTFGLPLVILINDGSASASEIVAGALQDHRRALIVGSGSFGKGSVQTIEQIDASHAIKLTTALYYTPSGRSIQAQGITPDITIEKVHVSRIEGINQSTEADLNNHLNNANNNTESTSQHRREKRISNLQLLREDNQLQEALNLLKGIQIIMTNQKTSAASNRMNNDDASNGNPE
ncbi:MAG: S41 family peptidase [Cellvibrio sp.]|nr:S41 family peptidase [Cellvibrio sp.]